MTRRIRGAVMGTRIAIRFLSYLSSFWYMSVGTMNSSSTGARTP